MKEEREILCNVCGDPLPHAFCDPEKAGDGHIKGPYALTYSGNISIYWPSITDVRRACLEGAGIIGRGETFPPAVSLYADDRPEPRMGLGTLITDEELASITEQVINDLPPIALTDQHAAALEAAIRAEGYKILMNDETGEIRLERAR